MKNLTLSDAETLVDNSNGKFWWETYGKTIVQFRPTRPDYARMRKDGYFNRNWSRGRGAWGTIRRYEVRDDGTFQV